MSCCYRSVVNRGFFTSFHQKFHRKIMVCKMLWFCLLLQKLWLTEKKPKLRTVANGFYYFSFLCFLCPLENLKLMIE